MISPLLLIPVVLLLALQASPLTLLLAGPVLGPFSDWASVGGVFVDSTDVVLAGLGIALLLRARRFPRATIPHFRLWLLLGLVTCLAYVNAPQNREYLTDPVRLAYQLYRYCWKPILYYPLTALLVTDRKAFGRVLLVSVVAADLFAIQATIDGYMGIRASGPFGRGSNALGGALIVPLIIALARFAEGGTQGQRWFYGGSVLLILRALVFTGSRGAVVGALCGGALLVWGLRKTAPGRTRLTTLAQVVLCLVAVVALSRGNPLERPSLQRFVGKDDPASAGTFRWRLEQRWPHFWKKVVQNPWLGVGTDSDPSLGKVANTPHNGYLSIAVTSGLPALFLFVALALAAVRSGYRAFRRDVRSWQGTMGLAAASAVVAVLVHNLVDTTVTLAFVAQMFWMLAAIAARMEREPAAAPAAVPRAGAEVAAPVALGGAGRA